MTPSNRRWIALLVAVLALTAGCTGAGNGGDGGDSQLAGSNDGFQAEERAETVAMEADASGATSTPMATAAAGDGDGSERVGEFDAQQFANRQLILTGHVAVEVSDFEAARSNLTEATERHGGFVSDTRQEVRRLDNESWTTGRIVLRVPRENFSALFETAEAEGELIESQQNRQDVTDQLVDIRARLDNLRAERDQLRELYERANTTEEVLQVQERLSDVQGEIERLEARQQSLRERVALATITVRLAEPRPEPDRVAPDQWYDAPLLAAFLESVDGVLVTLRAIAVGAAYVIPYLVVFGVPLAGLGYVVRRKRGGNGGGRLNGWLARRRGGDERGPSDGEDGPSVDEPDDQ